MSRYLVNSIEFIPISFKSNPFFPSNSIPIPKPFQVNLKPS